MLLEALERWFALIMSVQKVRKWIGMEIDFSSQLIDGPCRGLVKGAFCQYADCHTKFLLDAVVVHMPAKLWP